MSARNMRREALDALARRYPEDFRRIYRSVKSGEPLDEVTVAEWAPQWLKLRRELVRPGTLDADKSAVHKWIIPTIGDKPLAGLLRSDIRAVDEAMETAGLVDSSVQRAHTVLLKLLADAVEEGHDVEQRVLRVRKPGGAGISHRQAMPVEDARKVLEVAMSRPDASRWVAAILQGMRPAEARGLRWSSVDLTHGLMTVEWQLKPLPYNRRRDRGSGFRVPRGFESIRLCEAYHLVRPKTQAGIRVIPLVPWLRTELIAWRAMATTSPFDLVWTADGAPLSEHADRAAWHEIVDAADVWVQLPDGSRRRPLLYECRHTAATLLMDSGVDETTLTSIIGHSKITSTAAYLHADEARKLSALEKVSAKLGVTS